MLSLKTTIAALIAAISVIATASVASALIPQAFAQSVNINQSQSNTATQTANGAFADQEIEQGACQNAAGAVNTGAFGSAEATAAQVAGDDIDCS
jgi:hypothetical protein